MNVVFHRVLAGAWVAMASTVCFGAPPSIESIASPILQLGQVTQIEIYGAGMDQVKELVFYSPGLCCSRIDHLDEYKLLATIQVSTECTITSQAFRLRGDDGFSELRSLAVSRFPIIREQPRDHLAAVIDLDYSNQTVSGTLQSGDYDRYGIVMEKGQRLTAEAEAMRLGSELLDTVLKVYDPQGKLLLVSDDDSLLHQDPKLTFVATESGRYILELHETNYGGSNNSHYALHLGSFPSTRVAYPAGGQMGSDMQVSFLAVDQSKTDWLAETISLPASGNGFQLFAGSGDSKSASSVPFRLSNFPNVLEQEPNQTIASDSKSYSVPIAFNGILQAAADTDCFAFETEQGQALKIEVFADRIGSPIDSYLQLFDITGRLLAANDDYDSNDSQIEFIAPAQGRYVLSIRDKLNRGSPMGVYRIELTPILPKLTAFLPRPDRMSQRHQSVAVPQGNRTLAKVAVKREKIDGEVQLRFVDLPPGVQSTPVYVPPDEFWAIAVLQADASAQLGGALSSMVATASVADHIVTGGFEQTVDLIAESADRLYQAAKVDRLAVAVTPAIPFSIQVEQPKASLSLDGTIDLNIRLIREPDFTSPVRVEFPYLPQGCVGEPFITIDRQNDSATYRITAVKHAAIGDFQLAAVASISLAEGRTRTDAADSRLRDSVNQASWNRLKDREIASNVIHLHIGSNPIQGNLLNLAAERGEKTLVECNLQFSKEVPSSMQCQLEGLPRGVTAQPITITSNQGKAIFEMKISADAPVGIFQGVQCRLRGTLDGSEVSFVVPSASDLIIAEKGKLMKASDGKVLSPLEALRKQNEK